MGSRQDQTLRGGWRTMRERRATKGGNGLYLSAKQVAARWGVSTRTVLRMTIPKFRFGGKTIRYREEDIYAHEQKKRTLD
jgi:hypothetical protein